MSDDARTVSLDDLAGDVLTLTETARLLRIHPGTLSRLSRLDPTFPLKPMPGCRGRFRRVDVEQFVRGRDPEDADG